MPRAQSSDVHFHSVFSSASRSRAVHPVNDGLLGVDLDFHVNCLRPAHQFAAERGLQVSASGDVGRNRDLGIEGRKLDGIGNAHVIDEPSYSR